MVAGIAVAALSGILPGGLEGVGTLGGLLRLVGGLAVAGVAIGALVGLGLGREAPADHRGGAAT